MPEFRRADREQVRPGDEPTETRPELVATMLAMMQTRYRRNRRTMGWILHAPAYSIIFLHNGLQAKRQATTASNNGLDRRGRKQFVTQLLGRAALPV